jgi:protein-S-isoprenylcysteine O-methyltransferase Ste14
MFSRLNQNINLLDWSTFVAATIGFCLLCWTYFTIKNYSDNKLIDYGPYRYFVHPGYIGQFLIIIANVIFYRVNILMTIGICICVMYLYTQRVQTDENMLEQRFGYEYEQFTMTRLRLFPKFVTQFHL